MKLRNISFCVPLFAIFFAGLVVAWNHLVSSGWEKSLRGPFFGVPFSGDLSSTESSRLPIQGTDFVLSVHHDSNRTNKPVLAMHSSNGELFWARLLVVTNEVETLSNVQLLSVKQTRAGYKVRMTCDWEMGKEAGLLYLEPDLSFKQFALGW